MDARQAKDKERIRTEVHRGMKALGSAVYTVQSRMDRAQVVRHSPCLRPMMCIRIISL